MPRLGQRSPSSSSVPAGLLRSPWHTLHFACSTEYFPLTLTLSLREREQQTSDWCFADGYWANPGASVIERRWTHSPSPQGEDRGEGEPSVAHPTVQSVSLDVSGVAADELCNISRISTLLDSLALRVFAGLPHRFVNVLRPACRQSAAGTSAAGGKRQPAQSPQPRPRCRAAGTGS